MPYLRQLQEVPANLAHQISQICWLYPAYPSGGSPTKCLSRGDNTRNHIQSGPVRFFLLVEPGSNGSWRPIGVRGGARRASCGEPSMLISLASSSKLSLILHRLLP